MTVPNPDHSLTVHIRHRQSCISPDWSPSSNNRHRLYPTLLSPSTKHSAQCPLCSPATWRKLSRNSVSNYTYSCSKHSWWPEALCVFTTLHFHLTGLNVGGLNGGFQGRLQFLLCTVQNLMGSGEADGAQSEIQAEKGKLRSFWGFSAVNFTIRGVHFNVFSADDWTVNNLFLTSQKAGNGFFNGTMISKWIP